MIFWSMAVASAINTEYARTHHSLNPLLRHEGIEGGPTANSKTEESTT
jgi:hypothetical protein